MTSVSLLNAVSLVLSLRFLDQENYPNIVKEIH